MGIGGTISQSGCDGDALRRFITQHGRQRQFRKHACIQPAGSSACRVYLLDDGWIARIRSNENGLSAYTALHVTGDVVGADGLPGVRSDDFIALTDVSVTGIPFGLLRAAASTDLSIATALADLLALETSYLREALFAVGRQPSTERLCTFFLQTCYRLAPAGLPTNGTIRFQLPLTQNDLAIATAMTPVHLNRTLGRLRALGWLEFTRGMLQIIDIASVKAHAKAEIAQIR